MTTHTLTTVSRSAVTRKFRMLAPVLALGLLAVTACGSPAPGGGDEPPIDSGPGMGVEETPGESMPIEGIDGTWVFADGSDAEGSLTADSTEDITLTISGNNISGQSACNGYVSTFSGEPSDLTIDAVASTRRACDNALMDFDARYFEALTVVTAIIPTGGSLVLQGDGVNLNFLPADSQPLG